jgi:hypothetical protein
VGAGVCAPAIGPSPGGSVVTAGPILQFVKKVANFSGARVTPPFGENASPPLADGFDNDDLLAYSPR